MTTNNILDITPEPTLQGKIFTHNIHEALAELIDNSIDAKSDDGVKVEITIANDEIIIIDNGSGMDLDGLRKALTLGHSEKVGKLGRYGIGLKSSCSAMGHIFEIATKKAGEDYEYRVVFNTKELEKRGEWKVEYETNRVNKDSHYTSIVITDLKIRDPLKKLDKIIEELQMRFSNFLSDNKENISIFVNDKRLEEIKIDVINDPDKYPDIYTIINEETNYGTIKGWASLMPKGKQSGGGYGIHCYCNGRLIKPFNKIGFKSHPTYARLFGEIHIDFVELQNNKKDFVTDSPEYEEVENKMAFILKPLLRKSATFADRYNKKPLKPGSIPPKLVVKPKSKLNPVSGFSESVNVIKLKYNDFKTPNSKEIFVGTDVSKVTDEVKEILKTVEDENNINSVEFSNGENLKFSYNFRSLGKSANYLIYDYNPESKCLRIFSNTDSVIFKTCKDLDFISTLHVAEGLSRFLLSGGNKKNDLDAFFELYSMILEQTCNIFKK